MNFTSEEVEKLKAQRDELTNKLSGVGIQRAPKPPPKPKVRPMAASPTNSNIGLAPIHASKSSPSLNGGGLSPVSAKNPHVIKREHRVHDGTPTSHHHDHHGGSGGGGGRSSWKASLDSLRAASCDAADPPAIGRGYTSRRCDSGEIQWNGVVKSHHHHQGSANDHSSNTTGSSSTHVVNHHSHSNSDSGLSSLSGRTSTMSPISTMSTVSSVSSASSGSSSRASLRSASIVSSCTIPLDEEEEIDSHHHHHHHHKSSAGSSNSSSPSGTIQTRIRNRVNDDHSSMMHRGGGDRCSVAREKLPEEIDCEELSKELMDHLPSNDKKLTSLFGKSFQGYEGLN